MTDSFVKENLLKTLDQIDRAVAASGRKAGSVSLCAVSKFHPAQAVFDAVEAGQFLFGENRVQEAEKKFLEVEEKFPGKTQLHIIGSLQRNKIKKAVKCASCIQSVDRAEVLEDIEKYAAELGKKINIMFEMHTGEESKAGIETKEILWSLLERCAKNEFAHIKPCGLMTMAPFTEDESLVRKSFSTLRSLKEDANRDFPSLDICQLSMGMSGDFKIAIEEGSTMVRIGTAIFGSREAGPQ